MPRTYNPLRSLGLEATDPNNKTSEFSQCVAVLTDFTIAVSPPSVTVTQGNAATYTVTISPLGASLDDAVALSCSDLPAHTSCSFSPSAVTPGGSDATLTLTVTTMAPSSSVAPPFSQAGEISVYPRWPALLWLGLAGLALVTAVLGGPAFRKRRLGLHLPFAVVLLLLTLHGACGDGVTAPVGTFTFTITATSGPLEHATTATLIVQ